MRVAQQDSLTTRRSFVYRGATVAGVVALSTGRASAVEAVGAPQAPLPLADAGTSTAAPSSAVTKKSTRLVGSAINYAYAVKAGPWGFLNGHEAFDFEQRLAPEVEGPPGKHPSRLPP